MQSGISEDAKSLWNGMDWIVGGSGSATCLKPPHKLMIVVACCLGKRSFQLAITLKKNLKFTLGSTVTYLVSHFFTLFQTFPDWSKPPKIFKINFTNYQQPKILFVCCC